ARTGTLLEIQHANVRALDFSVRTNFASMTLLSCLAKVRKTFGIGRAAEVVTQRMMGEYAAPAARPTRVERLRGLDAWIARYGHRGPLDSDPCRPRFCELRDLLAHDLERGPAPPPALRGQLPQWQGALLHPFFWSSSCGSASATG